MRWIVPPECMQLLLLQVILSTNIFDFFERDSLPKTTTPTKFITPMNIFDSRAHHAHQIVKVNSIV